MNSVQIEQNIDTPPSPEWHIASLIAYCLPENFQTVKQQMQESTFVEIHTDDGMAKLVLTIEGQSTRDLSEQMNKLNDDMDLMSLQMVFHQHDQLDPNNPSLTPNGPST